MKSGTSVKPGYAYRWNETATTESANTLAAANSASGSAEILERGDLLICTEVTGNVPKYSVVQNNIDISDIEDRLSGLNDAIGAVSGRVTTAEGNITTLQGEVTTAKSDISGLKTRMGTAETNITKHTTDISNLRDDVDGIDTTIAALGNKVNTIEETTIPAMQTSINTHTTKITSLEGKFDSAGSANSAVKLKTGRKIDGVNFTGEGDISHFATCSTGAGTAAKTAALTNFALVTGAHVVVKFTATNTAANPTLNVNNTGAKAIFYQGNAIAAGKLEANTLYDLMYDGTNYNVVGKLGEDTPTVFLTDYENGETYLSTERNGDVILDVLVPIVGDASNQTLQDVKSLNADLTAEISWSLGAAISTGGVKSYACSLSLNDHKRVMVASATTQVVVELAIHDNKHYGYLADGSDSNFNMSLLCFDGTNLRVLKLSGATDANMNDLTNTGSANHDMFKFLPVGTKFMSSDGLTEYTKKSDTEVHKEVFVL